MSLVSRLLPAVEEECRKRKPGDCLPTTVELAKAHATSVVTMSRVIRELAKRGRVEPIRGRGIVVRGDSRSGRAAPAGRDRSLRQDVTVYPSVDDPVSLAFWRDLADAFMEEHPRISVKILEGSSKTPPPEAEVVWTSSNILPRHLEEMELLELSPYTYPVERADDLLPCISQYQASQEEMWWVPVYLNLNVVAWRPSLLRAVGVEDPPWEGSLTDLGAWYSELSSRLAASDHDWCTGWSRSGYLGWLMQAGIDPFAEPGATADLAVDRWREVLPLLWVEREMCLASVQMDRRGESMREAFAEGKGAVLIDGLTRPPFLGGDDLRIAPCLWEGPQVRAAGMALRRNVRNPVAAGYFLSFLLSEQAQHLVASHDRIPLRRSALRQRERAFPGGLTWAMVERALERGRLADLRRAEQIGLVEWVINVDIDYALKAGLPADEAMRRIRLHINHLQSHHLQRVQEAGTATVTPQLQR